MPSSGNKSPPKSLRADGSAHQGAGRSAAVGAEHSAAAEATHARAHAGGGHSHLPAGSELGARRLTVALALLLAFMGLEIVSGILAHSLALLSDAAHTLTDAAALVMSLVVIRLVRRPSGGDLTFGLRRAEILSAQANGATLLVLACLIVYGAVHRLVSPARPAGLVVLSVAMVGIVVNLLATRQLARAGRASMNIEGSYQHLLTDLFAFVATAIAGAVIVATGFERADAIAALLVAAMMFRAAYGLLKDSGRVLLEAAPVGMSVVEIGEALASHPRVDSVHDLHVWEVGSGFPSLSAHVLVPPGADCHSIRREIEAMLEERFGFVHTTLQVDHRRDAGLLPLGNLERGGPAERGS
jgi:cobalt-zinc-cadmium efflux system protein